MTERQFPKRPEFRLYVDETGDPALSDRAVANAPYLTLCGVAVSYDYAHRQVRPALEELKSDFFPRHHVDDPVILHRKELRAGNYPFEALQDPTVRADFDARLLRTLTDLDYEVIAVTLDKQAHLDRYSVWRYDPYHYCLAVLLERYVMWLRDREVVGDVLAESRGGKEDRRLKASFERLHSQGTDHMQASHFQAWLTSKQLKLKQKRDDLPGLQLAEVLANPASRDLRHRFGGGPAPQGFTGQVAQLLNDRKYRRSPAGIVDGYGRKWLP